ncbi:hypothetical protein ACLOJK_031373 [Asimina triloba]
MQVTQWSTHYCLGSGHVASASIAGRQAGIEERMRRQTCSGCLRRGVLVGSRLLRDSGQAIDFQSLVLLSEIFYYLYNTHLSAPHLFVEKVEREECTVVAELKDRFP